MDPVTNLYAEAIQVLSNNASGSYTQPAQILYPHQWLWDSCFIAIGLRHIDLARAQSEILSLYRGQWSNGMIPNMIFSNDPRYLRDRNMWRSWVSPHAPVDVATSGITQPPLLAEAIYRVGQKLTTEQKHSWYKQALPNLINHHQWLYNERDPHHEGLIITIHPWEVGMDNTPPWVYELNQHQLDWWIILIKKLRLNYIINRFRRDTRHLPTKERFDTIEALALFSVERRLRRKGYDINKILDHSLFAIEDLTFNSILTRNNHLLIEMAKEIKLTIDKELISSFEKTDQAFNDLWDNLSNQYYSRDFVTHQLIIQDSIATLIALYSGIIPKDNVLPLVKLLQDKQIFNSAYKVPTVPLNSPWYKQFNYWQGPSWVNTNWLIIDGLLRYGLNKPAKELRQQTLSMISNSGCYEYFNSITGEGIGSPNFSWTAALALDLINNPITI